MHPARLGGSPANHTVTAGNLTASGDLGVAVHADPQHREAVEWCSQTRLGLGSGEKDIVVDDLRTGSSHGGNAQDPRGRDLTEPFSDSHLTVLAECDASVGVHERGWQRTEKIVDAQTHPWRGEDRLETTRDRGLAGARRAVEDDDLGCHLGCHGATDLSGVVTTETLPMTVFAPSPGGRRHIQLAVTKGRPGDLFVRPGGLATSAATAGAATASTTTVRARCHVSPPSDPLMAHDQSATLASIHWALRRLRRSSCARTARSCRISACTSARRRSTRTLVCPQGHEPRSCTSSNSLMSPRCRPIR